MRGVQQLIARAVVGLTPISPFHAPSSPASKTRARVPSPRSSPTSNTTVVPSPLLLPPSHPLPCIYTSPSVYYLNSNAYHPFAVQRVWSCTVTRTTLTPVRPVLLGHANGVDYDLPGRSHTPRRHGYRK